jgi:8-oxo-dGTP diphosphatase
MLSGKSKRDKEEIRVASIAVYRDGKLLFLRRADNHKWTLPGGRLEHGEEPLEGAARELLEETGLEGSLDFIGDDLVPGSNLRVYAFRADIAEGTPTAKDDPDEEAEDFDWFPPDALPDQMSVPPEKNVTLGLLGLVEREELSKAEPEWRSKDGLRLPKLGTTGRKKWDKDFHSRLVEVFGNGDHRRLKPVTIPVTEQLSGHSVGLAIGQGGRNRIPLYRRMLAGGDKLPPLVVRRNGLGWHVVDGNARAHAALKQGVPHLEAYELLDPIKKSEHDLQDLTNLLVPKLTNDLRRTKYQHNPNHLAGHCYVASEALFHMLGGPDSGWAPQQINHEGDSHWYLKHKETGEILDPTAGQFKTKVPYEQGRGKGFLTKEPSKRAQELISRVKAQKAQLGDPMLAKGLGGALVAGALTMASGAATRHPPAEPQVQQVAQAAPKPWGPEGLHADLIPIAHLESSFGKNVKHEKNTKGEFHTAFGALGFKPVTAHEEYLKTPKLQELYPDLKDPADFVRHFQADPKFYNLTASAHFSRLKRIHGSPEKAAFAWRWGHAAANAAHDDQIQKDIYVQKYRHLATQSGLTKAMGRRAIPLMVPHDELVVEAAAPAEVQSSMNELKFGGYLPAARGVLSPTGKIHLTDGHHLAHAAINSGRSHVPVELSTEDFRRYTGLAKMAIRDLTPGVKVAVPDAVGRSYYDYSHMLSPIMKRNYTLSIRHNPSTHTMRAIVASKETGQRAGYVDAGFDPHDKSISPNMADLDLKHQGKGLGKAMYLALYSHAYHKLGARKVAGDWHSTMASRVHASITKEHDLEGYEPQPTHTPKEPHAFDSAFGEYEYPLK